MAATPSIEVSQGDVVSVSGSTSDLQISQADALAIYNFPSEEVHVSQADTVYISKNLLNVQVSQADVVAVIRGRVDDPAVRAWTYTLDGHDFYVLRLGNDETLVYDMASQQWSIYVTGNETYWSVYTGGNWVGGNGFAQTFGSNVIIGSDANGCLWFLDPRKPDDDGATVGRPSVPFRRRVTGQLISRGYEAIRVFEVQVLGSLNQLSTNADPDVELLYSDDRGTSYVSAGVITTVDDNFDIRGSWRSLGSFRSPGRLLRVEDSGALTRIDSFTVNMSGTDGS